MVKKKKISKRNVSKNKFFDKKLAFFVAVIMLSGIAIVAVNLNNSGDEVSLSPGQACPYGYTRSDFLCYRWLSSKDKYYINSTDVDVNIYPKNIDQPVIFCAKGKVCNFIDSRAVEIVSKDNINRKKCINEGVIPSGSIPGVDDTENSVWDGSRCITVEKINERTCRDSDNGPDISIRGYVTDQSGELHRDKCLRGNPGGGFINDVPEYCNSELYDCYVWEGLCPLSGPDYWTTEKIPCDGDCVNGVCLAVGSDCINGNTRCIDDLAGDWQEVCESGEWVFSRGCYPGQCAGAVCDNIFG